MSNIRRYSLYIILTGILLLRYVVCFLTGEYEVPDRWRTQFGEKVTVEGYITGKEDREKTRIFYLSEHFVIYDMNYTDIPIGCRVRVAGQMEGFEEQRNPGGFDARKYYNLKKYWARIYANELIPLSSEQDTVKEYLFQLREKWTLVMKEKMGEETGGMLAAMLLGNKGSADVTEREWYQKAGFGHLLAVSGCHVSMIASLIYLSFRKMRLPVAAASICTGSILFFYVLLCQSPVSAVRAYIMYLIFLGARMSGRVYQGRRTLILAAFTVLMWRPLDILDAGFLLSFGAMAGVWIVYPILNAFFLEEGENTWASGILLSIAIELVLLPMLLYFYYEIPVYSLVFGSVAGGLFTFVMISGSIGCLGIFVGNLLPISVLSVYGQVFSNILGAVWFPARWILNVYHEICKLELKLPGSRWIAGQPEIWKIGLYYLLLIVMLSVLNRVKKKWFCMIFLCLPMLFVRFPDWGIVTFRMLDVGQGDSFFLEGPEGMTYLFDGGSSDQNQPGKYMLEPYLKYRGILSVDYVFLSHGDLDHVNGVMEMLGRQDIGVGIQNLVLPERDVWDDTLRSIAETAGALGIRVLEMKEGTCLSEGDLKITALFPEQQSDLEAGNDASLVLDIRFRDFSVLMTGDLESEGENSLMEQADFGDYTILKAGHHGSKYSTSEEFIQRVQPKYAWISVGEGNRYGHPHEELLHRLRKYNVRIFRTDQDGSIEIRSDGFAISGDL